MIQFWTMRGKIMNMLHRYDEASAASQSALLLARELPPGSQTMHVAAWRSLAQSYTNLGRYNDAFQALIQAHDMLPQHYGLEHGEILQGFGFLSLYSGRLEESQAYFHRALDVWRKAGLAYTTTCVGLGHVALESGDVDTALIYFEQVYTDNHKRNYLAEKPIDMRNLGLVYMTLLQHERALEYFDEAQRLHDANRTEDILLMAYRGLCLVHLGQAQAGLSLLHETVQTEDRLLYHNWLIQLAAVRGLLVAGDTIRAHERAFTLVQQMKDRNPVLYGRALLALAQASYALNEIGAVELLREALEYEDLHGGRDTWLAYEALAAFCPDVDLRQDAQNRAAYIVWQLGKTLYTHPDLQHAFFRHPRIAALVPYPQLETETPTDTVEQVDV